MGCNVMYVCMYVCMCVCVYACMHVCMYACMHVCMYACMHVCMYACMHVCMYVCMYVCMLYVCCMYVPRYSYLCVCACIPWIPSTVWEGGSSPMSLWATVHAQGHSRERQRDGTMCFLQGLGTWAYQFTTNFKAASKTAHRWYTTITSQELTINSHYEAELLGKVGSGNCFRNQPWRGSSSSHCVGAANRKVRRTCKPKVTSKKLLV